MKELKEEIEKMIKEAKETSKDNESIMKNCSFDDFKSCEYENIVIDGQLTALNLVLDIIKRKL